MKKINLGEISVPLDDYASQGNAILGIRDSGKSYTATAIAEGLMDNRIPIIAFDPIGIWRYLRVPGTGKGYEVVVAGGKQGDLPLTPRGAQEIVRAAMRANVSLVLDLYDIHMSKADWRTIVASCIRTLLYENGDHGLRHIFIEEAAEFCPQNVGENQGQVYAEVEKLARMGGNALLGYTLINQRAEQVNKAVLELCDCLILHRQKGRNSINALSKWLDIASVGKGSDIIKSLPALAQGECWVWPAGSGTAVRTKVPAKHSFHPDRRARQAAPKGEQNQVDVSAFVGTMKGTLEVLVKEAEANDPKLLRARIAVLEREAKKGHAAPADPRALEQAEVRGRMAGRDDVLNAIYPAGKLLAAAAAALNEAKKHLSVALPPLGLLDKVPLSQPRRAAPSPAPQGPRAIRAGSVDSISLSRPQQSILDALAWLESVRIDRADRTRAAMLADQSPRSSGFERNISTLKTAGLIDYPASGMVMLTPAGRAAANAPEHAPTVEDLRASIRRKVSAPQWNILEFLIKGYPDSFSREEVAAGARASAASSGFERNISTLRSLGFIDYPGTGRVVAQAALFLE